MAKLTLARPESNSFKKTRAVLEIIKMLDELEPKPSEQEKEFQDILKFDPGITRQQYLKSKLPSLYPIPDKTRAQYLQGLTPEELPFAATQEEASATPGTGDLGLGQGAFSTPEKVSVLPKLGIATAPKKPAGGEPIGEEQDVYSYQADQKKLGRSLSFNQAKTELIQQRREKGTQPWDAQTYRNELATWQLKNPSVSPGEFFRGSRQSNPEVADSVASEVLGIPKQNLQKFLRFKGPEDFEKSLKTAPLSDTEKEFLRHQAEVWWGR